MGIAGKVFQYYDEIGVLPDLALPVFQTESGLIPWCSAQGGLHYSIPGGVITSKKGCNTCSVAQHSSNQ